jgi:proteasome activator subunit 4
MFNITLRSLCKDSEERLYLEEPIDPYAKEIELTDTSPAFTQQYLAAFRQPLPQDETQAMLQDRLDTGWLVWGKKMEVARLSGWEEEPWTYEAACKPAVDVIAEVMGKSNFWRLVSRPLTSGLRNLN